MKKEWIYFIAGAGLMAAVMIFNMPKESSADCEAVAKIATKLMPMERAVLASELTPHEQGIFESFGRNINYLFPASYVEAYRYCISVETPSK